MRPGKVIQEKKSEFNSSDLEHVKVQLLFCFFFTKINLFQPLFNKKDYT